jgi:hypothetical protein
MLGLTLLGCNVNFKFVQHPSNNIKIDPQASTDPFYPDPINNLLPLVDTYTNGSLYYYYSWAVGSGHYYVLSMRPNSSSNRFDIYLYSDSFFSNSIPQGYAIGDDRTKYVVYRASSDLIIYPKIYRFSGTGDALIYASPSAQGYEGTTSPNAFDASNYSYRLVSLRTLTLQSTEQYKIEWESDPGTIVDLHVFRLVAGSSEPLDLISKTDITSTDYIEFIPSTTDDYAILLVRQSESGDGTLTINAGVFAIPAFEIIPILFAFAIIIAISLKMNKKQQKISL